MADRSRRRPRAAGRASSTRVPALLGLSILLIVDVVLIVLALASIQPVETPAAQTSEVSVEIKEEEGEAEALPVAQPVLRSLVVGNDESIWRAERGSCDAPASLEISTDATLSWSAVDARAVDARQIFWLWTQDGEYAQAVVSAGDDCELTGMRTFTGGEFWQENEMVPAAASYLDEYRQLRSPRNLPSPCPAAVDVEATESTLAVLCEDGTIFTIGSSDDWVTSSQPGAVAIAANADLLVLAAQGVEGCDGIAVMATAMPGASDDVAPAQAGHCQAGAVDATRTAVAVGAAGAVLWTGLEMAVVPVESLIG